MRPDDESPEAQPLRAEMQDLLDSLKAELNDQIASVVATQSKLEEDVRKQSKLVEELPNKMLEPLSEQLTKHDKKAIKHALHW